ncbi:hypothetical protein [Aestuariimicrobium sp. Y1814]|uniref:hypothetical protein n=1 Tax=Aestuariimicrobium sp. Y1814 TaxID=3418742 RepID=UPI003DA75C0A
MMGIQLVKLALREPWPQTLIAPERLVLIAMSAVAIDPGSKRDTTPARYYAGTTALIESTGLPQRSCQRALAGLVEKGAIRRVRGASPGRPAEWEITTLTYATHGTRSEGERVPLVAHERVPDRTLTCATSGGSHKRSNRNKGKEQEA